MANDLKDFVKRIGEVAVRVEHGANLRTRLCALAVDQAVVSGTPVHTGTARSNWQVTLDNPALGTISAYSPGQNLGIGESGNRAAAELQAREVLSRRKPEQTIYISNNVNYIGELNRGSSPQAEAGFVEKAVEAGVSAVKGARIL